MEVMLGSKKDGIREVLCEFGWPARKNPVVYVSDRTPIKQNFLDLPEAHRGRSSSYELPTSILLQ